MCSSATRESVLENTELLELVLLQLDLRTLICTQRVCQRWLHATKSPTLQAALFFRPIKPFESHETVINPLLSHFFPAWFAPRCSWKERYELEITSWTRDPVARERFLRPEASWKRMTPVQPPLTALRLVTRTHIGELRTKKGTLILQTEPEPSKAACATSAGRRTPSKAKRLTSRWNGSDINMGVIYHLAQTYLRERVVSYFCMLYPERVQQELDRQVQGALPGTASSADLTVNGHGLLDNDALEDIRAEQVDGSRLTMIFEQLRNWFEPSDPTGNWLEEQNAIFARLNLRDWTSPVVWDAEAIEWDADDDG